jgi:hypothetical protein
MDISYPLDDLLKEKQILVNDFLPEGFEFVRFGLKSKKSMLIGSISYLTIENYRINDSHDERKYIIENLKKEMIDFLKQESSYSSEVIFSKLKDQVFKNVDILSNDVGGINFYLPENGNLIGSYFSFNSEPKKGYPFFSGLGEELRQDFHPNSNIFNFKNTSDYMSNRIQYRYVKNELMNLSKLLEKEKVSCDYVLGKVDSFKIYKKNFQNSSPLLLLEIIKNKQNYDYTDSDFLSFCRILNLNICILRAWSDNVSVENFYYINPSFVTICIFVVKEGQYGIDGKFTDTKYLPGALIYKSGSKQKIKYYLDPKEDELIIFQLSRYMLTNNSSILESNYSSYLSKEKFGKSEIEKINIPQYGNLEEILKDNGNIDEIGKIIEDLNLV